MSSETLFELEVAKTGEEAATLLRELADGLSDGTSIELAGGDRSVTFEAPAELAVEIEVERETGEDGDSLELELEFEWVTTDGDVTTVGSDDEATTDRPDDETGDPSERAEADDANRREQSSGEAEMSGQEGQASLARFQVFRDRADEWRWRLVHRNGNVIATSGEGYTTRQNAEKGLRSVVANAPGADVDDEV